MFSFSKRSQGHSALRTHVTLFLSAVLIFQSTYAQAQSTTVPDDVNVPKYRKIWEDAKVISDQLRSQAEGLRQQAQQLDQDIANSQQAIVDNDNKIARNTQDIGQLQQEIPRLRQEIAGIAADTSSRRSQLNANSLTMRDFQQRVYHLDGEYLTVRQDYDRNTVPTLRGLQQRVADLSRQLDDRRRELAQAMKDKKQWEDALAATEAELVQVNAQWAALQAELPQVQQRIQTLSQQVQGLGVQAGLAQVAVQNSEQQVSQAQAAKQSAQTQLNQAQGALNQARAQLQQAEQALASARQALAAKEKEKADLDKEIPALRQAVQQAVARLAELDQLIAAQEAIVARITQNLPQVQQNIQNFRSNISQGEAEIAAKEAEIKKLQDGSADDANNERLIAQLKAQIAQIQARLQPVRAQLQQAEARLAQMTQNLQAAQTQVTQLRQQKQAVQASLPQLRQRVQTLEASLAAVEQALPGLRQAVVQAEGAKSSAAQSVASLETTIAPLTAALNAAQQNLQGKEQQLAITRQALQAVQGQLQEKQSALAAQENRRQEILTAIPQKQQRSQQLAIAVQQNRTGLQQTLAVIQDRRDRIRDCEVQLAVATRDCDQYATYARQQEEYMQRLRREISQFEAGIADLARENSRLESDIAQNDQGIRERDQRIVYNQGAIVSMGQENQQLAANTVQQRQFLTQAQAQSPLNWQDFQAADGRAVTAEADTAQKRSYFEATQSRYDAQLADAQTQGENQGNQLGSTDGTDAGALAGAQKGALDGRAAGTQEGLEAGYLAGLNEGFRTGKEDGYRNGRNAPDNFADGKRRGLDQGKKDAEARARQVAFPEGRRATRSQIMSQNPSRRVQIDQGNGRVTADTGSVASLWDFSNLMNAATSALRGNETTVSPGPEFRALNTTDPEAALTQKIRNVEQRLAEMRRQFDASLRQPGPTPQIKGDENKAQCNGLYVDFYRACRASFVAAYEASYIYYFKEAYTPERDDQYSRERQAQYQANLPSRQKMGRDEAYPIMYAKYDAKGAEDARNVGYQEGKTEGYNTHIDQANRSEFQNGVDAETQFFNTNAVVTVQELELLAQDPQEGFIPGARVTLNLNLMNFGKLATDRNVKVRLRSYGGLEITEKFLELASVPGQVQAKVLNVVSGSISANVQPNTRMGIEASLTLPDGSTVEKRVEVRAQLHVKLALTANYNRSPKIKNFIGARDTHDVKVKIQNNSRTETQESFLVTLESNMAEVTVQTTNLSIATLPKGAQSKEVMLQYYMADALKNRQVNLVVRVYYGPNRTLVHEEPLMVTAK